MLKTMFSAGINKINTKTLAAGNIATGKIKNKDERRINKPLYHKSNGGAVSV